MSSWTDLDLVNVSTEMALVPEGKYVFELLPGAKYNQWDKNKIEVAAKVSEGEYTGRIVYFSYGDPVKVPAMAGAFKRLEKALTQFSGVAIEAGDDPTDYLNEQAGSKFIGFVRHRLVPPKPEDGADAKPTPKQDLNVFKISPVPAAE